MEMSRRMEIQQQIDAVVQAFNEADGDLSAAQHRESVRYTAVKFNNMKGDTAVSAELAPLLDKIALHAYKITDKDVEKLIAAGYSEEQIFELVVGGALGVGLASWQNGISAIGAFFESDKEKHHAA